MPQKKKPARETPQARGDAQNPISCSRHQAPGTRRAGRQGMPTAPGQERPPGTRGRPPRPAAQTARGQTRGKRGPARVRGSARLPARPPAPRAAGATAGSRLQRGRRRHGQQKAKPPVVRRRGRALPPSHRSGRLCGRRVCGRGSGPLAPQPCPGGGRGSGARPRRPRGDRTVALRHGRAGTPGDGWGRGQSAPLERSRGPHVGKQSLPARST